MDLYARLRKKKVDLWLDQFELSAGIVFQARIERALRESDAILMVLSHNSKKSNWTSFEGAFFYALGDRLIVPVIVDNEGRSLANKLPFVAGRLYVDFSNANARRTGIAAIAKALTGLRRGP